jgi:signal transduction histidine kinase
VAPPATEPDVPWRTIADGRGRLERRSAPNLGRAIVAFGLASLVALASILFIGTLVSRDAAEDEALRDATAANDLLGRTVLEPALEDGLLTGDKQAIDKLDRVVRRWVLKESRVRVKLWTEDGRIVYSDQPTLIGTTSALDADERAVVVGGDPYAEISDLSGAENASERELGRLVEVYRAVQLPNGTPLLFETYSQFSQVAERKDEIMRTFTPITIGAVVLLQLCQLPLVWAFARRLRASQRSSERLLRQAVEASTAERRRIAGDVHDGVVQGLAGASYVIAGAVDAVERGGQPDVARDLREAAGGVRESIRGLRSMLVEIYPPSVSVAGLPVALQDLVAPLRAQGIEATAVVPPTVDLPHDTEALIFRVAQEALRNVARHSGAGTATLTLTVEHGLARLEVADDGVGLDVDESLGRRDGHVGMQVLRDLAEEAGALLQVASVRGAGTTLRLDVATA